MIMFSYSKKEELFGKVLAIIGEKEDKSNKFKGN
jgi:hypothetical protein